jgi:RNA polymerase sigma-70 factor (ECF subfamily)
MTPEVAHSEVKTKPREELDIVHAGKGGKLAAFETLVKKCDRKLFRVANRVTHNIEDSQDAVQEDFFKAYQHLVEFREACKFSTWLIRITLNQSLMRLRRQRSVGEVPLDENCRPEKDIAPMEVADRTPNPEQLYWASEFRDILAQTLEEGRPSLRVVFVPREIKGLSIDQTSIALGLRPAAVKARLWRARSQLRQGLSEHSRKITEDLKNPA